MSEYIFDLSKILNPKLLTKIKLPDSVSPGVNINSLRKNELKELRKRLTCPQYKRNNNCNLGLCCSFYHNPIRFNDVKYDLQYFFSFNKKYKTKSVKSDSQYFLLHIVWICKQCESFQCINKYIVDIIELILDEIEKYLNSNHIWNRTDIDDSNVEKMIVNTNCRYDIEYIVYKILPRFKKLLELQNNEINNINKNIETATNILDNSIEIEKSNQFDVDIIRNETQIFRISSIELLLLNKEKEFYDQIITEKLPECSTILNNNIETYIHTVNTTGQNKIKLCYNIINLLENIFKNNFYPFWIQFRPYGSIANGLASDDSDIDLSMSLINDKFANNNNNFSYDIPKIFYKTKSVIERYGRSYFKVENLIAYARVPVLKLIHIATGTNVSTYN